MPIILNPYRLAVAGGGAPTAPADAGHLTMWYRADQLTYLGDDTTLTTTNGDRIYHWKDIQSSGHDAIVVGGGASATRPTLATGISGFNGQVVLDFDASTTPQYFRLDATYVATLTEGEQFIVMRAKSDPPTGGTKIGATVGMGQGGESTYLPYTDSNLYDGFGSSAQKSLGAGGGGWAATARLYNSYSKTSDWQAFVDGTSIFSTGSNTVAFPTTTFWGPNLGCGASTANGLHGYIAEYLFYDHKLGTTDRATVTSYLKTRYGIA